MPKPKRHLVIGPANIERWVDEGDLGNLPEGFAPATASQIREYRLGKKYSGAGAKVAAFGHGLGSSLTMGGLDVALTEGAGALGGDEAKARMQASINEMREAAPAAHMMGEVGGLVGGIVGSAGKMAAKGALGKALAVTPGAGAIRGGAALERALMRAGAGRGTAMVARAGAEGAMFGAGHTLSEASLGNVDLTGEALFASMGENALWGAGTAGVLHGTGALLGGAARKGKDALSQALRKGSKSASRSATERLFGHGTDALDDVARGGELADDEARRLAQEWSPEGAAHRKRVFEEAVPKRDALVRDMVATGNTIEDDMGRFHLDHTQGGKPDTFAHLVSETPKARAAAVRGSESLLVDSESMLNEMTTNVVDYGGEFGANTKFVKNVRNLQSGVREAIDSGAPVREIRTRLESLKRYLDNNVYGFQNSSSAKGKGFLIKGAARVKTEVDKFRSFLENEEAWGQAGRLQKPMNAAIHEDIGSSKYLNRKIKTRAGIDPNNPYRERLVFDPEKVEPWGRNLVNPKGDLARQELLKQLNARANAAEAVLEHGKPSAEQVEYLTRIRDNSRKLATQVDEASESMARLAQLEELSRQDAAQITLSSEFGGRVTQALKGVASAVTGGATAGAAETVGAAASGGVMGRARKLYAIETIADKLRGKMDGSLGKVFSRAAEAAEGVPLHGGRAARYFADEAKRARTAKTRREEFEERSRVVMARNAQQASDAAKGAAAPIADAAPNTTVAAANTAARAQAYLAAQLPTDGVPGAIMGPPPEASAVEVDKWLRKLRAVEDPTSILDDLSSGKLSRDSVEAVKAVYPALYEQMRADVMGRITDMQAEGKQLPYRERIDLGTLLELPTDPMLRPDVMAAIQASYAQQQPNQPTPKQKVPDLASAYETESEQTEKDAT